MREYKDIDFARAERGPIAHLWDNEHWMVQEKCDGWRIQVHFGNPCSRLYAITRGCEEVGLNLSHLMPQGDISRLQYSVFDGELIPEDGEEFHSLASIRSQRIPKKFTYKLFDVCFLNGIDTRKLPLEQRLQIVSAVHNSVYLCHPFVKPVKDARSDKRKFLNDQLLAGEEGVVLKDLRATYGNGWLKAKKVSTFDAIIVGIEPGYDMPHGKVHIAVADGLNLRDVGKCGIQVAQVRAELNKNPNNFIGKVIELKALKIDPSNGMLREPRFIRMRYDLSVSDATWEKLNRDALKIELE